MKLRPATWLTLAMFFLLGGLVALLLWALRPTSTPAIRSDIICDFADRCESAFTVGVRT